MRCRQASAGSPGRGQASGLVLTDRDCLWGLGIGSLQTQADLLCPFFPPTLNPNFLI